MKYTIVLTLLLLAGMNVSAQNFRKMSECVIEKGVLKEVVIDYDPATGDRSIVVNGVRKNFYDVYPTKGAGYADGLSWFINNEPVAFKTRNFVKYGLPRVLRVPEIVKSGDYKGINVYTEAGLKGAVQVIYLPVRQGCEFQPYQVDCGKVQIEKGAATATTMVLKAIPTGIAGKITYSWSSQDIKIVKGQGTATITVDIKNKKDGESFNIALKVNGSSSCPITRSTGFVVAR